MKKILVIALAAVIGLAFSSCNRRNAQESKIEVTVLNSSGVPQQNARVHMYLDAKPNRNTRTGDSKQSSSTDNMGVAKFNVNLKNNDIVENRTNAYFAVFYNEGNETYVAANNGTVLKRGDVEKVTLRLPVQ